MLASSEQFKIIILNMDREKLHSFLWMYDQYVAITNSVRAEDEDWNMLTLSMEDFYEEIKYQL